jgi:MoxR-like ATPase
MFNPEIIQKIAHTHKDTFKKLHQIEKLLNARLVGMEEAIRALILSVASGEALVFIGPPGTAKSRLIRDFCSIIGLIDIDKMSQANEKYFEYLLTPFTEPGELFGFYDIAELNRSQKLKRLNKGVLQKAKVIYLDEIFNASSAILNSLLSILNEGIFHDRGERVEVNWKCLFAATNQPPNTTELEAVFDRFVLRCYVDNVAAHPERLGNLIYAGWNETYGHHSSVKGLDSILGDLDQFRDNISKMTDNQELVPNKNAPVFANLAQFVSQLRDRSLSKMSNRRLVKLSYIMLINRIFRAVINNEEGKLKIGKEELMLVPRFFLDRQDQESVRKLERLVRDMSF